jgi:hypothetical protein
LELQATSAISTALAAAIVRIDRGIVSPCGPQKSRLLRPETKLLSANAPQATFAKLISQQRR